MVSRYGVVSALAIMLTIAIISDMLSTTHNLSIISMTRVNTGVVHVANLMPNGVRVAIPTTERVAMNVRRVGVMEVSSTIILTSLTLYSTQPIAIILGCTLVSRLR
jgi:hypothetical protein